MAHDAVVGQERQSRGRQALHEDLREEELAADKGFPCDQVLVAVGVPRDRRRPVPRAFVHSSVHAEVIGANFRGRFTIEALPENLALAVGERCHVVLSLPDDQILVCRQVVDDGGRPCAVRGVAIRAHVADAEARADGRCRSARRSADRRSRTHRSPGATYRRRRTTRRGTRRSPDCRPPTARCRRNRCGRPVPCGSGAPEQNRAKLPPTRWRGSSPAARERSGEGHPPPTGRRSKSSTGRFD